MPRRRELWDVCRGIATSFISRNNDIGGWWGIGVLCRTPGPPGLDLDLCADSDGDPLVRKYGGQLVRQLQARRIPSDWVAAAGISVRFEPHPTAARMWRYAVTVELRDDLDHVWSYCATGRCWPHSWLRETRSTRRWRHPKITRTIASSSPSVDRSGVRPTNRWCSKLKAP